MAPQTDAEAYSMESQKAKQAENDALFSALKAARLSAPNRATRRSLVRRRVGWTRSKKLRKETSVEGRLTSRRPLHGRSRRPPPSGPPTRPAAAPKTSPGPPRTPIHVVAAASPRRPASVESLHGIFRSQPRRRRHPSTESLAGTRPRSGARWACPARCRSR